MKLRPPPSRFPVALPPAGRTGACLSERPIRTSSAPRVCLVQYGIPPAPPRLLKDWTAARRRCAASGFELGDHHETATARIERDAHPRDLATRLPRTRLPAARHPKAAVRPVRSASSDSLRPARAVRLAVSSGLGLATEAAAPGNRNICLAEKVFVDVHACMPQVTPPTAARPHLSGDFGAAAPLHHLTDPARTPARIDADCAVSNRVAVARHHARQHGRTPCNLEREQDFSIRAAIGAPRH